MYGSLMSSLENVSQEQPVEEQHRFDRIRILGGGAIGIPGMLGFNPFPPDTVANRVMDVVTAVAILQMFEITLREHYTKP